MSAKAWNLPQEVLPLTRLSESLSTAARDTLCLRDGGAIAPQPPLDCTVHDLNCGVTDTFRVRDFLVRRSGEETSRNTNPPRKHEHFAGREQIREKRCNVTLSQRTHGTGEFLPQLAAFLLRERIRRHSCHGHTLPYYVIR